MMYLLHLQLSVQQGKRISSLQDLRARSRPRTLRTNLHAAMPETRLPGPAQRRTQRQAGTCARRGGHCSGCDSVPSAVLSSKSTILAQPQREGARAQGTGEGCSFHAEDSPSWVPTQPFHPGAPRSPSRAATRRCSFVWPPRRCWVPVHAGTPPYTR